MIIFEHVGIRASAFKHGLTRENIRHAVGHPVGSVIEVDDGPRLKYEFVGHDLAANEIEIINQMKKNRTSIRRRVLTGEKFTAMFAPGVFEDFARRNETMGPFEADPSRNTPEHDAWLDRWVEGYCASGHDPNYAGPDDE